MDKFFTTFGKIALLLAVVGGAGYLTYTYSTKSAPVTPTNDLSQSIAPSSNPQNQTPTSTPKPAQTVTAGLNHAGGIAFPSYIITVPADWTVDHQSTTTESPTDNLTLTQGQYKIRIFQGATGGAPCLYPGDADQEGPSSRFISFVEFSGTDNVTFRRGPSQTQDGTPAYTVCMKSKGNTTYGQPTGFGHISYSVPTTPETTTLTQMDAIVATLKVQ